MLLCRGHLKGKELQHDRAVVDKTQQSTVMGSGFWKLFWPILIHWNMPGSAWYWSRGPVGDVSSECLSRGISMCWHLLSVTLSPDSSLRESTHCLPGFVRHVTCNTVRHQQALCFTQAKPFAKKTSLIFLQSHYQELLVFFSMPLSVVVPFIVKSYITCCCSENSVGFCSFSALDHLQKAWCWTERFFRTQLCSFTVTLTRHSWVHGTLPFVWRAAVHDTERL